MNKLVNIFIVGLFLNTSVQAKEVKASPGYSYFTIGVENVTYKESGSGVSSTATTSSPILNTGGLFLVNDQFDFSLDALATFSPSESTEKWESASGTLMQKNSYEYSNAETRLLVHYKYTPEWRILFGPSFRYQSYTRSDLRSLNGYSNSVFKEGSTWKESSTDLSINVGLGYDSGSLFKSDKIHSSFKWVAGVPAWSHTENTRLSGGEFSYFGYHTMLSGNISYQVIRGLHLGWYVNLKYEKRFESGSESVTYREGDNLVSASAILPEAETYGFSTGLQLLWKL